MEGTGRSVYYGVENIGEISMLHIGVRYNKVHFIEYLNIFYKLYFNFRVPDPNVLQFGKELQ